jgi:hypothetical protein
MSSAGSWVRLIIGLVLSAEVLRNWLFGGGQLSNYALGLAAAFVAMTAVYFVFKF